MKARSSLVLVAAIAAALTNVGIGISPAFARQADAVTVGFADLNLASAAGRATFDRRVGNAARMLCGTYAPIELKWGAMSRACRAGIVAAAQPVRNRVSVAAY